MQLLFYCIANANWIASGSILSMHVALGIVDVINELLVVNITRASRHYILRSQKFYVHLLWEVIVDVKHLS